MKGFLALSHYPVAALLLIGSTSGGAATTFTADLTNAGETGTVIPTLMSGAARPASFGSAVFVLNDAQTALTMTVTAYNIDFTGAQTADANDNLLAAHIHASPTAAPGINAPVVWGFFGTPFNDNTPNDEVVTPFATGVGGTITGKWDAPEGNGTTLTAQLSNLLTGHAYINFHTVQFGGGEIRGMITAIPEAHEYALMLAGLVLLGFAAFRRNAAAAAGA